MLAIVFVLAVVMEMVDSSIGMMYGTLLSPVLILLGFSPKEVVPALVLSQALGGGISSIRHNGFHNYNILGYTRDMKVTLSIVIPGVLAAVLGALVSISIPSNVMNWYIGLLVISMGVLCVFPIYYTFRWWVMWLIGLISGFNKAASGGGFGPITSTGKILAGVDSKASVATTTAAEVPICLGSFIVWMLGGSTIGWELPLVLCVGSLIGGYVGPYLTYRLDTKVLKIVVGITAVGCGLALLILKAKI